MKVIKTIEEIKQIAHESKKSVCHIILDYLSLKKDRRLLWEEYYKFEFEKKNEEVRKTILGVVEETFFMDILNPFKYYILARNKYLTHVILENVSIPTAKLYCYYSPQSYIESNKCISYNLKTTIDILRKNNIKECVIKGTEGTHGKGVFSIHNIEYKNDDAILHINKQDTIKLSKLLQKEPLLFEEKINQIKQFNDFNPTSVNTIRFITTLMPSGEVKLLPVLLRIGRNGSFIDNACDGGNIEAEINLNTGEISGAVEFNGFRNIKYIDNHPDTGKRINGESVQNWEAICLKIKNFQKRIPFLKAIGWDVAITEEGPVVIEINDFWDLTGQIVTSKGRRIELRESYFAWKEYYKINNLNYEMGRKNPWNGAKILKKIENSKL